MRFQTRLLITYSLLIILLAVILGISFYQYNSRIFEENAYSNLEIVSDKMSQQLDNLIRQMDFISTYLLSNGSFISSLSILSDIDRNNPENLIYVNESIRTINNFLFAYSIDRDFYRVSIFNDKGDFLSSNFRGYDVSNNLKKLIDSFSWKERADDRKGRFVVLSPYADPWKVSDKITVFGLARSIQGSRGENGYLEVQNRYSELEKIFSVPEEKSIKVVAVTDDGGIFYSNGIQDRALLEYYSKLTLTASKKAAIARNPVTGTDEIIVGESSSYTGIRFVLAQDKDVLLKPLVYSGNAVMMIGIFIVMISVIYIYIFSKQLTKPIRQLKAKMEGTELENLPEKITFESSNNEIQALNRSFQHLRERLNEAVTNEIRAHSLQMQASFDSLQAQVNPHFIYNILNVLSNKGIVNGDDEICEICDGIAAMLRYSTSTLKRSATIAEELEYVRNYLLLMQKRYEQKLAFNIDIDQAICSETLPKIVLQQIVENAINHGFESIQTTMNIDIRGYASDDWWYIEITDNGQGFDPMVLSGLEARMETIRKELFSVDSHTGFEIGGLGLLNTYARLLLFCKGQFVFRLKNVDGGGAQVTIGGVMSRDRGEDKA